MRAYVTLQFDRPVIKNYHYISPGSYEVIAAGKNYQFDFNECESYGYSWIDGKDSTLVHFELRDEDYDTFPEIKELREHLHEITEIVECYVYTGEVNKDQDINVVAIKEFSILDYNPNRTEFPEDTEFIVCKSPDESRSPKEILYSFTNKLLSTCACFHE